MNNIFRMLLWGFFMISCTVRAEIELGGTEFKYPPGSSSPQIIRGSVHIDEVQFYFSAPNWVIKLPPSAQGQQVTFVFEPEVGELPTDPSGASCRLTSNIEPSYINAQFYRDQVHNPSGMCGTGPNFKVVGSNRASLTVPRLCEDEPSAGDIGIMGWLVYKIPPIVCNSGPAKGTLGVSLGIHATWPGGEQYDSVGLYSKIIKPGNNPTWVVFDRSVLACNGVVGGDCITEPVTVRVGAGGASVGRWSLSMRVNRGYVDIDYIKSDGTASRLGESPVIVSNGVSASPGDMLASGRFRLQSKTVGFFISNILYELSYD
ncbi:hypothetical protein FIQ41_20120 [Salmonella enterica subsp. enterica]|nr:hypothetical protein [Salmonella enterica subsp. enterica serovar Sandiego]